MSEYADKLPKIKEITLDLRKAYGAGYLNIAPQEGPQQTFISCMSGVSGQPEKDEDFYLIFYGGAK